MKSIIFILLLVIVFTEVHHAAAFPASSTKLRSQEAQLERLEAIATANSDQQAKAASLLREWWDKLVNWWHGGGASNLEEAVKLQNKDVKINRESIQALLDELEKAAMLQDYD